MRVTFRLPLPWTLLLTFSVACLVACVAAWFILLSGICSNPRTPAPETQHVIAYNCHGMKVFITPVDDALLHWLGPIGAVFIFLTFVSGGMVARAIAMSAESGARRPRVRIVSVPPGEAPQWVREKWIGLELPLAQWSPAAQSRRAAGVLTGPRGLLAEAGRLLRGGLQKRTGYAVNVLEAVAILERASPEAAQWWRTQATHLMSPSRRFLFPEEVCALVSD